MIAKVLLFTLTADVVYGAQPRNKKSRSSMELEAQEATKDLSSTAPEAIKDLSSKAQEVAEVVVEVAKDLSTKALEASKEQLAEGLGSIKLHETSKKEASKEQPSEGHGFIKLHETSKKESDVPAEAPKVDVAPEEDVKAPKVDVAPEEDVKTPEEQQVFAPREGEVSGEAMPEAEKKESVPLLMPDGSIYETDKAHSDKLPAEEVVQVKEAPFIQLAAHAVPEVDSVAPKTVLSELTQEQSEDQGPTMVEMSVAGDGHMERVEVHEKKRRHLTKQERNQVAGFGGSAQSAKEQKKAIAAAQKVRKSAATTTEGPDYEEMVEDIWGPEKPDIKLNKKGRVLAQGFDTHVESAKEESQPAETPTVRTNARQSNIRMHDKAAKPHQAQEPQAPTVRSVAEPEPVVAVSKKRLERGGLFGLKREVKMAAEDPPAGQASEPDPADPTPLDADPVQAPAPDQQQAAPPVAQDPPAAQKKEEAPTEAPKATEEANSKSSKTMLIVAAVVVLLAVCVALFVILGSRAQVVEWGQATVATIAGRRGEGADRELSEKRHLLSGPQKVMLNTQRTAGNTGHASGTDDKAHSSASGNRAPNDEDGGRMKSAAAHLEREARRQIISGADSSAGSAPESVPSTTNKPVGRVSRPPRS